MKKKVESPFAKNFAQVLKQRNLSQKAVGEIAGVAPSVISDWLAGAIPQDLNALMKICQALNCDFQFLLTGIHSRPDVKDISLSELFDVSDVPDFEGVFQIQMKRLTRKKK
jgi:transcriptional regulator with XRE-family HTH domain